MTEHTSNPLLVTDLYRPSILSLPFISDMLRKKTEEEGSTQGNFINFMQILIIFSKFLFRFAVC